MPETIKALIVIITMGSLTLTIQSRNLPEIISKKEFRTYFLLWISVTLTAFLSHNYWIFIFFTCVIISVFSKKESQNDSFSIYVWLLPLLPMLANDIPGIGGIRFIFELNYPRLLSLAILFPLFLNQDDKRKTFLRLPGDKIFAIYLLINILISTRNGELTNIIRTNLYLFLDMFLPYYVASRSFKNFQDFKKIAFVIFASISILASIALFETIYGWRLYASLLNSLDINYRFSSYLFREGVLRAASTFSSSIVLGYMLVVGMGMRLAIDTEFNKNKLQLFFFVLYGLALLATVSRGPWVGCLILFSIYVLLHKNKAKNIKLSFYALFLSAPILIFTSFGQKIISLLPFFGGSNEGSISYREELFEKSWAVIQQHPLLGSNTYLKTPEMLSLTQGQGIIDIVNSYLRIALDSGLLGVGSFVLFFVSLLFGLYKAQQALNKNDRELHQYATGLIATLASVLFIIATVSSIDIVGHVYWLLAGLASAFLHFLNGRKQNNGIQIK